MEIFWGLGFLSDLVVFFFFSFIFILFGEGLGESFVLLIWLKVLFWIRLFEGEGCFWEDLGGSWGCFLLWFFLSIYVVFFLMFLAIRDIWL